MGSSEAEREPTESEQAEGSDGAEKAAEAEDRRLRQAAVKRDFDGKLQRRIARTNEVIDAIGERRGRDRGESLAEISREIAALDDLLAEQAEATRRAGGRPLHKDAADQIARFHADAENLAGDLRHVERVLQREKRVEEAHIERVPGLMDLDLSAMGRTIVTKVAQAVAVILASHVAANRGDLLAGISEYVMKACAAPDRLGNSRGLKVKAPLPIAGWLEFDIETRLSDDIDHDEEALPFLGIDLSLDGEPRNYPQVELVEEEPAADCPPDEPEESGEPVSAGRVPAGRVPVRAGLGWPVTATRSAGGTPTGLGGEVARSYELAAWLQDPPQVPYPGGARCPDLTPPGTGIVIWGSAKAIALGTRTRILSADILLSRGREAAFEKVYDGTVESAGHAMRAARGLEVVVFLDPDIQGGVWIDVDPVTQAPAATLLIDMPVSADSVRGFRLLAS